jgi:pyridoxine/pyridoxamine 5'-phosphate oxidase
MPGCRGFDFVGLLMRRFLLLSHLLMQAAIVAECVTSSARCQCSPASWVTSMPIPMPCPHTVEFWQADKDRQHVRVQYRHGEADWTHTLLWP